MPFWIRYTGVFRLPNDQRLVGCRLVEEAGACRGAASESPETFDAAFAQPWSWSAEEKLSEASEVQDLVRHPATSGPFWPTWADAANSGADAPYAPSAEAAAWVERASSSQEDAEEFRFESDPEEDTKTSEAMSTDEGTTDHEEQQLRKAEMTRIPVKEMGD
ncbi:unnamed protein product [Polarella glacialis]|uniref:Uncharacterized protein n=1 Tax=Polarella glacialis TaxID=89957 RepID=A0A813D8J7_POLGL|nr:unnamed protein product [Polarella glacialis]